MILTIEKQGEILIKCDELINRQTDEIKALRELSDSYKKHVGILEQVNKMKDIECQRLKLKMKIPFGVGRYPVMFPEKMQVKIRCF